MKVGFTNGVFDIIHAGHTEGFKLMKQHCDHLVVGINSDESAARQNKSLIKRPINKLADRMEVLSAIRYIDAVVVFDEDTPERIISMIEPDVLFKGEDYNKPGHPKGKEFVKEVIFIPLTEHSTTKLIKRIQDG